MVRLTVAAQKLSLLAASWVQPVRPAVHNAGLRRRVEVGQHNRVGARPLNRASCHWLGVLSFRQGDFLSEWTNVLNQPKPDTSHCVKQRNADNAAADNPEHGEHSPTSAPNRCLGSLCDFHGGGSRARTNDRRAQRQRVDGRSGTTSLGASRREARITKRHREPKDRRSH